ncbi:MAG: AAA family ATPase [Planctomycetaceae bacterium]|nr:AAA family ATPase [Planctomycetaceae bacterium]
MNQPPKQTSNVVVTGDVTIDWNLAHIQNLPGNSAAWAADDLTRACWQRGGAALMADLIDALAAAMRQRGQADAVVQSVAVPRTDLTPTDARFNHAYAMYSPVASGDKLPDGKPKLVWRVTQFLGVDRVARNGGDVAMQRVENEPDRADIVVLDDAALGFRQQRSAWPRALLAPEARPWIILKIARPVAQGPLWDHLIQNCADRLITVMTVGDLRRSEVQISRQISWERTAQDLFWELIHNPRVNGAARCAATVVSFDAAGAFLLTPNRGEKKDQLGGWKAELLFDPDVCEGGWEGDRPGKVIGNTVALTAGIVRQLLLKPTEPDFHAGIQSGLAAQRRLFSEGYGAYAAGTTQVDVAFPLQTIAEELATDAKPWAIAAIQDPVKSLHVPTTTTAAPAAARFWTILEDHYRMLLESTAEKIVLDGLKATIRDVPIGRFGGLQTVDRREIEALHSIQNLLGEYCDQPQKRPLSIAVFGPPGSGKSFGVEQVAKSLRPGLVEVKTFNLSQFGRAEELLAALHQVRDIALQGKLPLVFWDEFDTAFDGAPLGWLRYFLAPMQDGSFQQGEVTHPIGKCIFVFAGGTSRQMSEFGKDLESDEFKSAKVPDFVSRLKGFLNVLGPNRQATDPSGDPYYIIRRAILLRSILERNTPNLIHEQNGQKRLSIDGGVLRALLRISEYKHGVRSIESIISMSSLAGHTTFQRSSLPPEAQLDLHVSGLEFLSHVQAIELSGELLERLAEAAHKVYRAGKERDGWKYGSVKSEQNKTHPLLIEYADLPEEYKESNRTTVRNIPKKLARAGYVMMPSRSNEPAIKFPGDDLESLAEYEHELWMTAQLAAGFRLGTPTDAQPLLNEYLVPWSQLDDKIKQIDRDLVRGIPKILAEAGYAVLRVSVDATKS